MLQESLDLLGRHELGIEEFLLRKVSAMKIKIIFSFSVYLVVLHKDLLDSDAKLAKVVRDVLLRETFDVLNAASIDRVLKALFGM